MKIDYEGETYDFDLEEITLAQATYLHKHLGLTLQGLDLGLAQGHPDALRAVWWLIQAQAGKKTNIDNLDFKIVKLSNAVQAAYEAENEEKGLNPDGSPKEAEDPIPGS
jgi:hypothetical protein